MKMMSSNNDVTGDKLISKIGDKKKFDEGYDRIFSNKKKDEISVTPECIPHWVLGYDSAQYEGTD